jgi:hypothetical protein
MLVVSKVSGAWVAMLLAMAMARFSKSSSEMPDRISRA